MKFEINKIIWICLLLSVVLGAALTGCTTRDGSNYDELIGIEPDDKSIFPLPYTNHDNSIIAYVIKLRNQHDVIIINGRKNAHFLFTPEKRKKNTEFTFDFSLDSPPDPYIRIGIPVFSDDNKQIAYKVEHLDKKAIVLNSQKGNWHDDVSDPVFSPNGKQFSYTARNYTTEEGYLYVNNKVTRFKNSKISSPLYSPDSQHMLLVHITKGLPGYQFYLDNKPVFTDFEFDYCTDKVFSPDSQRLACHAKTNSGQSFMIVDGQAHPKFDNISFIRFSPDNKHIAYVASRNNTESIVVDGKVSQFYKNVEWPIYSRDSLHLTYVVEQKGPDDLDDDGLDKEGQYYAVLDNKKVSAFYNSISSLQFTNDNRSLLFYARNKNNDSIFYNAGNLTKFPLTNKSTSPALFFSPDGKHIAREVITDATAYMIVDGIEHKPYRAILSSTPMFSKDSKHFSYVAIEGEKRFVVVDGHKIGPYKSVLSNVHFTSSTNFRFYAVKEDGNIYSINRNLTLLQKK